MKIIIAWWIRLPLLKRLLVIIGLWLFVIGNIMQILSVQKELVHVQKDLQEEKAQIGEMFPFMLAEAVVVGDYASVQEQINHYVQSRNITRIFFVDNKGVLIQSEDTPFSREAPAWFGKAIKLCDVMVRERIMVGGVDYGTISVTLSPQSFIDDIWSSFLLKATIIFFGFLFVFISIWLLLHKELKHLEDLKIAASNLSRGDFTPIVLKGGTPEICSLFDSFNHMAQKLGLAQEEMVDASVALKKEKHWLETILNTLDEGVYVINHEGKILHVNAQASILLGYKEEEMLDKEAHGLFHAHDVSRGILPKEQCPLHKALVEGVAYRGDEAYFKCKNTHIIPVEIFAQTLIYEEKNLGMVVAFRDITQKKAEEAQMKLLSVAVESTTNAVVITNKEAIIEWANPAFEKLTGYKLGEVIGHNPHELIGSGKHEKSFYEQMWQTILSFRPWHGEVINKHKNGQLYYESLHITPVVDKRGNISHFIAIKEDISERKKMEEKMEHLAFYDALTDLPNRRLLMDRLKIAFANAKRYQAMGAIFYLDLDYFKRINDELGHDMGDALLQEMAKRLIGCVRQGDSVARLGGDEFVIVLQDLDATKEGAMAKMKQLAQKVQDAFLPPFVLHEKNYSMNISLGGILFDGTQESVQVLKEADDALYKAKQTGRNKSCFIES